MAQEQKDFSCDICLSCEAIEVPHARQYTGGKPIHICTKCGFVYVKNRRPAKDIANDWSDNIFGSGYTAIKPAIKARLTFVAEFLNQDVGLRGKRVCDIGAGEGVFLDIIRKQEYGATVFGIEPSKENCTRMEYMGIESYRGTIEEYDGSTEKNRDQFDIVTIMWTIENCMSPRDMLTAAYGMLKPDGYVLVATGSRILVPFKKPLHLYLGSTATDLHSLRFSANTLQAMLAVAHFVPHAVNRYIDQDVLCVIARKGKSDVEVPWQGDNFLEVYNFFERWHVETSAYYATAI